MERNRNYAALTIIGVMGYIFGILACITIVGLIIGIPMIMGAKKYMDWSKISDEELLNEKPSMLGWTIFFCIFTFPFGLVALIPYFNLEGGVDRAASGAVEGARGAFAKKDPMQDKIDKIEKLASLKEKGLIDEDDFKIAKAKILSE